MNELAKSIILIGIVFTAVGVMILLLGKVLPIGKLPGDIMIKKENFSFYFPVTTCVIISIILSLIFYLWNHR